MKIILQFSIYIVEQFLVATISSSNNCLYTSRAYGLEIQYADYSPPTWTTVSLAIKPPDDVLFIIFSILDLSLENMYKASGLSLQQKQDMEELDVPMLLSFCTVTRFEEILWPQPVHQIREKRM